MAEQTNANQRTSEISQRYEEEDAKNDSNTPENSPKEAQGQSASTNHDDNPPNDIANEKDIEVSDQPDLQTTGILAKEDYSIFTVPQKRAIILAGSFIGWFSPVCQYQENEFSSIARSDCNVSLADVRVDLFTSTQSNRSGPTHDQFEDQYYGDNISGKVRVGQACGSLLTSPQIVQGLAPMMIAGFSDKAGRRPAYVICFVIYIAANLGLALQNDYVALLILRMLQSAGSSGTIALAQGLVGDCIVSSDRGKYVAYASLGSILGPTVSPLIGGLLSQYLGWHWYATHRTHELTDIDILQDILVPPHSVVRYIRPICPLLPGK